MDPIPVEDRCVCTPTVRVGGVGSGSGASGSGSGSGGMESGSGKDYPPQAAKADMLPLWVCRVVGMVHGGK